MSAKPPSTLAQTGISKSAAKKKAKKAKSQVVNGSELTAGEADFEQAATADPNLFNFPPGAYPVDIQYDTATYYDEADVPVTNGHDPHSLPFPFDYSSLPPPLTQPPYGSAFTQIASSFNITHEDLFSTAAELYKRMGDSNFGSDDPYWSNLAPHVKQFIRQAMPFSGSGADGQGVQGANGSSRDMYDFAHKIVSAASQSMGLGPGVAANLLNGRQFTQPMPIGNGDELGFHRHPDVKDEEYEDEEDFDVDEPEYAAPNGDLPKKKNKKKKKKSGIVEPPPAQLPPPAVKQPLRQPIPPQPPVQPALNPPPPPVLPAAAHAPPSSRAAGKQPMNHAPVPAAAAPARSARAAGKAPAAAAPAHNHNHHNHPPPLKPNGKGKAPANGPPAKIWAQSSAEDRENIRQFWHALGEAERRDLVQIEKDAVLRKLKEQHRHSCGCAVCGRKKVSIEHEVDQLYDQYLDDLGSYTAEQRAAINGRQPAPPGAGPFPGSVEVDATGQITRYDHRAPDPRVVPPDVLIGAEESDEYDDEEDYDEEGDIDDEEVGSDEADAGDDLDDTQPPPQPPVRQIRPPPPRSVAPRPDGADEFLSFSSNLATIKGGILTVADDLLKNDGSKFLEMMEQLAVARHVREEQNIRDLEETDEEEYDEDKEEPITEAERLEEGKRMFQIFAARMFEQRVLQAYREKVAKQREEQLLRELEEEEDSKRAKEERKAKEAQKKKDKKKLQKQRQDEEKAAKDAAVAAEQHAAKAKAEEADRERQKRLEEERSRREAVKKAAQDEQLRIAADRRKRQQEEKEREEEAAKKKREREEKARKEREAREKEAKDKERRDKEERAAKEKAEKEMLAKEKADKAEEEKLLKEAREGAEKERLLQLEEDRIEKARLEETARKERGAGEQAKILAVQQAQRERAQLEKASAERAAADRVAQEKLRSAVPVRSKATPRNGPAPQTTPPLDHPSPIKASSAIRPPTVRTQKTPQPFFPQPMPTTASFPARTPQQSFAPGLRPAFPSQSPIFSQVQTNAISPNPPTRGFPTDSSPPFELLPRTAPIGMGFPPVKSARMASVDETFSPSTAPIGAGPRAISGELIGDFRREPAPIGPPGPIGRPAAAYLDQPSSSTSTMRSGSPAPPDQVFGSAALGADDEIVQPARRNLSNGWDASVAAAPGAGRWSANPSIWGNSVSSEASGSSWGGSGVPTRQPSFGGISGVPTPFGTPGPNGFPGLFSPPGQQPPPQQHHSHH